MIPIEDRLEGNPEALACRERYREIVKVLSKEQDSFVLRLEVKLNENGTCTLIATSTQGYECDMAVCELAVRVIAAMTGVKVTPPDTSGTGDQ